LAVIDLTGGNPPPPSPGAGAVAVVAAPAEEAPPPLPVTAAGPPPPPAAAAPAVATYAVAAAAGLAAPLPAAVTAEQADALVAGFKLDPAGNILAPEGKHGREYNIGKFLGLSGPVFQAIKVTSSVIVITAYINEPLQRDIRFWAIRLQLDFDADFRRQDFVKVALVFKKVRAVVRNRAIR
jgi:hypothetical protein